MKEVGDTLIFNKDNDKLGKGAYGSVYRCVDEHGNEFAVKQIKADDKGLQCLMEASVMSTLNHPNLHRAIKTHASADQLYLISEVALGDLSYITRKNKPTWEQLQIWTGGILQAVACLHKQKLIHCDIKGSNILLFNDNVVKLTDFTLTIKNTDHRYQHNICTCTHRPPEVWLDKTWDTSADIWSLGVTLAEIALGEFLFPYQENLKNDASLKTKTVNCLLDFGIKGPEGHQLYPLSPDGDGYLKFVDGYIFKDPNYRSFRSLILPMLRLNPEKRPSIFACLEHSFLKQKKDPTTNLNTSFNFVKKPYNILSTSYNVLDEKSKLDCVRRLNRFTMKSEVIDLTIELFSRTQDIAYVDKHIRLMSCLWIASKLLLRSPIESDVAKRDIIAVERTICLHLSFRLHVPDKLSKK